MRNGFPLGSTGNRVETWPGIVISGLRLRVVRSVLAHVIAPLLGTRFPRSARHLCKRFNTARRPVRLRVDTFFRSVGRGRRIRDLDDRGAFWTATGLAGKLVAHVKVGLAFGASDRDRHGASGLVGGSVAWLRTRPVRVVIEGEYLLHAFGATRLGLEQSEQRRADFFNARISCGGSVPAVESVERGRHIE